jgi:hypothetical protein
MASIEIPGFEDESSSLCPTLTMFQRAVGFGIMLAISVVLGVVSWIAVFNQDWTLFGIMFTLSSLCAIGSSLFLAGPMAQIKKMFDESRWIATVIYLLSMVLTLVVALVVKSGPLVICCCIVQYLAALWYGLSYIPGARAAVKACCRGATGM